MTKFLFQKGHTVSKETREKISLSKLGKKRSPLTKEWKEKIGKANKGKTSWLKGKHWSEEHKSLLREISLKKGIRPPVQIGGDNINWKGEKVGYTALHDWVRRHLGDFKKCSYCKTTTRKMYHWANISRNYRREESDWIRLCVPCHKKFDLGRRVNV